MRVTAVKRMLSGVAISFIACGGITAVAPINSTDPSHVERESILAFANVRVVGMTDESIQPDRTVIVRGGRIAAIGEYGRVPIPDGAIVIEGRGRYLLPSLIDMHVHARRTDLALYLRAGIAHVRNMWGHPAIATLVKDVESGSIAGPSIHTVSPGVDGTPPQWPFTRQVLEAAAADTAIATLAGEGWGAIKVYQRLSVDVYDAVAEAARRRGMPLVGHVPTEVPIRHALAVGQRSIEHLTGYDREVSRSGRIGTWGWSDADTTRFAELARITAAAGTWNCPTLAIYVKLAEQNRESERPAIIASRRRMVLELVRAGAPLLAGTDAGIDVVPAGVTLHQELAEFTAAGLTGYESLRAATIDAGRFLGRAGLGTVTVDAPADLLLVRRNPLLDLSVLREFDGLVLHGSWYSRAALDALRQ
jgi:imidazolonepropionase-like amidohydrolase